MRIELDAVTVLREGRPTLRDVSLDLPAGAVTAILGPSGSGKTTLLSVIAGLLRPDRGAVRLDSADVTRTPPESRRLGVVFQDLRLFPFLDGRANVEFPLRLRGLSPRERPARIEEALALAGATGFASRAPDTLSGGEQQRLALARALAGRPGALLLDEPFAWLDAQTRRTVREEVRSLCRALRLTAVVVTHDREDAFALASRLVVLRDGRVEQAGDPRALYDRPVSAEVATLLGEATLLPIEARKGDRVRVGGRWLEATGDGERALVRPEHLRLVALGEAEAWDGEVKDVRFAGANYRVELLTPVGSLVALAAAPPNAHHVGVRAPEAVHTVGQTDSTLT
jgi:ABC-type Fe3+/spermidine/putrescine transport system ATPase subunit